jgi:phage terminase small subunit
VAKRGRKAQSNAEKNLKGERRPSRQTVTVVEFPKVRALPEPPEWMNDDGKTMWDELGPILVAQRILTDPDFYAFAELCYIRGELVDKHRRRIEPTAAARNVFARFCADFGITPTSRTRIGGSRGTKENPFERNGPQ